MLVPDEARTIARLGQACTLWGACLVVAACEPMPAIFSHLSAQVFFGLLPFGEALQLEAMHRASKPVGAENAKQPVRGHSGDLAQGRSQALSYAFQATQPAHVGQDKGRSGALFAPCGCRQPCWRHTRKMGSNKRSCASCSTRR